MLKASDLRCAHGDNTIFDGLSLTLSGDRRVGLVGPNGAGKTTLLRLLAGVDAPERGSVALGPGDRIGYLPQEPPGPELTIDRLLGAALGEVWSCTPSSSGSSPARRARRAGRATARRRSASARSAAGRCRRSSTARAPRSASRTCRSTRRSAALSGGEAARALLAGVLLARPTILLLDEPTNHLDLDGLAWLEEFLAGFPGAVLVVSHDRRFLDTTVSQILELDGGGLTPTRAATRRTATRRRAARARLELDYEAQQKRRRRLEADIAATRGYAKRTENTAAASAPTSSSATPRRWRRRRSRASGGCGASSTPRRTSRSRGTRRRSRSSSKAAAAGGWWRRCAA